MTTQPSKGYATAFNMPLPDALTAMERSAKEVQQASEHAPAKESFGQRIAKAVKAKLQPRNTATPSVEEGVGFGQKVANAVKDKAGNRRCSLLRPTE
jgi:ribosomal protein L9